MSVANILVCDPSSLISFLFDYIYFGGKVNFHHYRTLSRVVKEKRIFSELRRKEKEAFSF